MSAANRFKPHVVIIPEDDANRQIANGFINHTAVNESCGFVTTPSGGWQYVLNEFKKNYIPYLRRYPDAHVVLLIDFDCKSRRREECEAAIPDELKSRVFIIGARDNPEKAKQRLN